MHFILSERQRAVESVSTGLRLGKAGVGTRSRVVGWWIYVDLLDLLHACEVRPVLSLRFLLPSAPGELPGPSKWSSGDDGSSSVLGVIVDIGAVGCVWRVVVRRL